MSKPRPLLYPYTHDRLPAMHAFYSLSSLTHEFVPLTLGCEIRRWHITLPDGALAWAIAGRDLARFRGLDLADYVHVPLDQMLRVQVLETNSPRSSLLCFTLEGAAAYLMRSRTKAALALAQQLFDDAGVPRPPWLKLRRARGVKRAKGPGAALEAPPPRSAAATPSLEDVLLQLVRDADPDGIAFKDAVEQFGSDPIYELNVRRKVIYISPGLQSRLYLRSEGGAS